MPKHDLIMLTEITVEDQPELSLEELCRVCQVTPDFLQELIAYGVIEPHIEGFFDAQHLRRVRIVRHLQQDLEVNLAGAALVLDLMGQIEEMRAKIEVLNKLQK